MNEDYENEMFREIQNTLRIYKTSLSPNLSGEEKASLMYRIRHYRSQHYPLLDDNPVSEFRELEKYWEKDTVSVLELMIILSELYKEVYRRDGE